MLSHRSCWLLVAALLVACASAPERTPASSSAPTRLDVVYSGIGAGMGHTPSTSVAVVPRGQHPPLMAALSLQRAVARFNAQLIAPEVVALKAGDNDLRWESDIGPLVAAQLARCHEMRTRPSLQNQLFGVRFSGRLLVVDNELRFSIESRIFGRGAGEAWRELNAKDYDGSHFSGELSAALKQELLTPTAP